MFIESGVVSEGSIKGVMSGKHYNRAVRSHKIIYEALQRLRFEAVLDTLDDGSHSEVISFVKTIENPFPLMCTIKLKAKSSKMYLRDTKDSSPTQQRIQRPLHTGACILKWQVWH